VHPDHRPHWSEEEESDEGDELWIVSYADMVTLLFGFFVILYSFSTIDDKKFDQMSSNLAQAFKASDGPARAADASPLVEGETRHQRALRLVVSMMNIGEDLDLAIDKIENGHVTRQELANAREILQEKFAGHDVAVKGKDDGTKRRAEPVLEVALPVSVLFRTGTNDILPKSRESLRDLAAALSDIDGIDEVAVSGHTDSRPPSKGAPFESNWSLSAARAGAVAKVLIDSGVNPEVIRASGMADLSPLFPEYGAGGKPLLDNMEKNRRVQIVVRKRVPGHGG
jgi:chemotaxis protein MotB